MFSTVNRGEVGQGVSWRNIKPVKTRVDQCCVIEGESFEQVFSSIPDDSEEDRDSALSIPTIFSIFRKCSL